jgi:hypothetical protein
MKPSIRLKTAALGAGLAGTICLLAAVTAAQAPPPTHSTKQELPDSPPAAHAKDPRLADVDARLAAARAGRKSEVEPLETQLKALKQRFDAQIDSLQAERKAIVEEGESPALRELDQRETTELAALDDREKGEVAALHQRYDAERKALKESYAQKRKAIRHK